MNISTFEFIESVSSQIIERPIDFTPVQNVGDSTQPLSVDAGNFICKEESPLRIGKSAKGFA